MKMTTKLVSLLTILFVFYKFGEPTQVMMSIYGDKGFLFHSQDLTTTDIVGFVYEDANGAFAVVNCTAAANTTYFNLKGDCTVLSGSAVTVAPASGATEATALRLETVLKFPETGVNTNIMVAKIHATVPILAKTKTAAQGTAASFIIIPDVVGSSSDATAAVVAASTILCNNLDTTNTAKYFTVATDSFGQVNNVESAPYLPIMKCLAAVRSTVETPPAARAAFATFILVVTDVAELTGGFNSLAFPSVVLLPQTTTQPANATVVGYINGINTCPTGVGVTFASSPTTPCKGTISIDTSGNYSFGYDGTTYYLLVTDASGATTCPATTTTTCEDFAFNFKYSNTLIGMLLIFMLKMLQSY